MGRTSRGDNKSKQQRQQAILRLIQENPISRQETLLEYLSKEGFDATQATISRDIRELPPPPASAMFPATARY